MADLNGTEALDQEIDKVEASLEGVEAALRRRSGALGRDRTLSADSSGSSSGSGSSSEPEDPGRETVQAMGPPSKKMVDPYTAAGRPTASPSVARTPAKPNLKATPKPTPDATKSVAQPLVMGHGGSVGPVSKEQKGAVSGSKLEPTGMKQVVNGVQNGVAVVKDEGSRNPIPRISHERRMQQLAVARGKKYGSIGGQVSKINNILKVSRLLQNGNPMVLKAQQALDYIMEIPGIQLPHIQLLLDQWEERFLALLYQYVRLHNRMEYAAESKKLASLATLGGTYKDVRTFEQDLVEVKPGDEVELEVPIVVKDQQPSTSTAHHGLPTSHHSSSSSKPRKAKKSRKRHHSSGHVNGNNQLNMVEPLVDN